MSKCTCNENGQCLKCVSEERDKLRKLISRMAREIDETDEIDIWNKMDVAPKDGTSILGFDGDSYAVVYWQTDGDYWSLTVCGNKRECAEWRPTHWIDLPELNIY